MLFFFYSKAFATIGALESAYLIALGAKNATAAFAIQQMLDCISKEYDCNTGKEPFINYVTLG